MTMDGGSESFFSGVVEAIAPPAIIRPAENVGKTCPPPKQKPVVQITFDNKPTQFLNNKSTAELSQKPTNTSFSHGPNEVFVTGGITSSHIKTNMEVAYAHLTWEESKINCTYPHQVKIVVTYAPTVYIASNYKPGSCRYQSTMQHELRHVNTDIITLKEFIPWVEAQIKAHLANLPYPTPLPSSQQQTIQNNMMAGLQNALSAAMNTMNDTRMKRQQLIDTRQEYLRLTNACPQEKF